MQANTCFNNWKRWRWLLLCSGSSWWGRTGQSMLPFCYSCLAQYEFLNYIHWIYSYNKLTYNKKMETTMTWIMEPDFLLWCNVNLITGRKAFQSWRPSLPWSLIESLSSSVMSILFTICIQCPLQGLDRASITGI